MSPVTVYSLLWAHTGEFFLAASHIFSVIKAIYSHQETLPQLGTEPSYSCYVSQAGGVITGRFFLEHSMSHEILTVINTNDRPFLLQQAGGPIRNYKRQCVKMKKKF